MNRPLVAAKGAGLKKGEPIKVRHSLRRVLYWDIGKALMFKAAEIGREAGASELVWVVYKPNKRAAEFYERLGAEFIEDLHFMRWNISQALFSASPARQR